MFLDKKKTAYISGHCSRGAIQLLDRSGEKPYCTFIICIRFHFVNTLDKFICINLDFEEKQYNQGFLILAKPFVRYEKEC